MSFLFNLQIVSCLYFCDILHPIFWWNLQGYCDVRCALPIASVTNFLDNLRLLCHSNYFARSRLHSGKPTANSRWREHWSGISPLLYMQNLVCLCRSKSRKINIFFVSQNDDQDEESMNRRDSTNSSISSTSNRGDW